MSLTTNQPSVYTSANIYREMDTPKYLNTITYNDRLNDRSKRPLNPILPRPPHIPIRNWKRVIYPEYSMFKKEENRLSNEVDMYASMSDTFTINGQKWNDTTVRDQWYANNNMDLQIQLSELIEILIPALYLPPNEILLYGFPQKLLCLSFATPDSDNLLGMLDSIGCFNIKLDTDIDTTLVPTHLANQILSTISGLLYTSQDMCTYQSRALTRTFSDRSDVLMRFKSYYIDGSGMNTSYGASKIDTMAYGLYRIDPITHTRVLVDPPKNNYVMAFWDVERHVIAGWILFELISDVVPESYTNNIHKSFNNYIHISAFCGNITAGSSGATTFIAMLMNLCKLHPTRFHGIILDSVSIIETLLLYYSLGFRSVLYHEDPSIPHSNTTVYVKGEHLMVWNADPTLPNFPSAEFDIHPTTPSILLDKVRLVNRMGIWNGRFESVRPLDDLRAFIAIATKGFPLNPVVNGMVVEDYRFIHQNKLYKDFKKWMKNTTGNNTRRVTRIPHRGGGYYIGGDGPESLVPYLYTKPSVIYYQYTHGTLNNATYRMDDPTFGYMDSSYEYDADNEQSPNSIQKHNRISRFKGNRSKKRRSTRTHIRQTDYNVFPI